MKLAAVITHTSDRMPMLKRMLLSIKESGALAGWSVYLVAQGYDKASVSQLKSLEGLDVLSGVYATQSLLGCHGARVKGFQTWSADVWLNLDDDMELIVGATNYSRAVELASRPGNGCVSIMSARSKKLALSGRETHGAKGLRSQPVICTGGGMVLSDRIADMARQLPMAHYLWEDLEWSVQAYVMGYLNWRDWSSWAVHVAGAAGGRRGAWWTQANGKRPPSSEWFNMKHDEKRKSVQGWDDDIRVKLPDSSDLKEVVHRLHTEARANQGWE